MTSDIPTVRHLDRGDDLTARKGNSGDEHRAATYDAEVILLLQCAMYAIAGTLAAFYEVYKALGLSFRSPTRIPDAGPGIQHGEHNDSIIRPLLRTVHTNLTDIGVPPKSPVFAEFGAELRSRNGP